MIENAIMETLDAAAEIGYKIIGFPDKITKYIYWANQNSILFRILIIAICIIILIIIVILAIKFNRNKYRPGE